MLTNAHVLIVGSEILEGRRRDANLAFLAPRLARLGIPVEGCRIVPDVPGVLPAALRELAAPGRLILTTGGLGPTRDDLTRFEVAEAFGRRTAFSEAAKEHLQAWAVRAGREISDTGLIQCELPVGAVPLDNPRGTAMGIWLEHENGIVVSLPGVPAEVVSIWDAGLSERLQQGGVEAQTVSFFTSGLGEGIQEKRMGAIDWPEGVDFCSLPGAWGVEIQLSCRLDDVTEARHRVGLARERLLPVLVPHVIEPLGLNPAQALVATLKERGQKVAFAESCTAGLGAGTLASVPGSSAVLEGSIVAYANRVKTRYLEVSEAVLAAHGAVSQPVVEAMSEGVCSLFGADLGLSASGVAGPDGGTPEKPVGTVWLGASFQGRTVSEKLTTFGSRDEIRHRAAWRLIVLGLRLVQGRI
ncbi:MAG: hypothetical protein RL318_175 [Fibrobacterota bacterium]|jgi:nicotinamide-nucleotide amidase